MNSVVQNPSVSEYWNRFTQAVDEIAPNKRLNKIWFHKFTPVQFDGTTLTAMAPAKAFTDYLMNTHRELIRRALVASVGEGVELLIIKPDVTQEEEPPKLAASALATPSANTPTHTTNLNQRYRFDNYIEGESNRFAMAAARSIAESPQTTPFNPFFVYGGSGFGKTHLIQAIGNYCVQSGQLERVLYVTSEQFINHFIQSIRTQRTTDFAHLYRNVDMLILDDIQFFQGKERTLAEFFHTFNTLYQAGKQIILSSDRPPKDLEDLDERLTSRFASGLVTEVTLPDYETRVAILSKRAEERRTSLDSQVIEYLANHISTNVRDLEGALNKLIAHSALMGRKIDVDLARVVIKEVAPMRRVQVSMETIAEACARFYNVPVQELKDRSRKKEIATIRQVSMYLCHKLTKHSLRGIALHFGRRDHSTVIHAVKTVEDTMSKDPTFQTDVTDLMRDIQLKA